MGWIVAEVPVDSDEESEIDKDGEDEETGGGLHGRLTADLFVYAYAEILKGKNLGEDGAKALADVLTPKTKEGHQSSNKGGKNDNKASLEPGACENATKLILRYKQFTFTWYKTYNANVSKWCSSIVTSLGFSWEQIN